MDLPRPPLAEAEDANAKDLVFQITDWYIPEADRDWLAGLDPDAPPPVYEIIMYGVTEAGNSVTVRVKDFEPYFFVKLPQKDWGRPVAAVRKLEEHLRLGSVKPLFWDKKKADWAHKDWASRIVPRRLSEHLCYVKCIKRKDFWGFTNGHQFPFAKIRVKSLALFNALKKYFNDQWILNTGYQPYESNIDPFLRFIHERNISPCGWVRVPAGAYTDAPDLSRTQISVDVDAEDVHAVEINKIAPLLIASFDIECTSSHGDFPVAVKDYRKLAQDLVGAVVAQTRANAEDISAYLHAAFDQGMVTPEISRVYPKTRPDPVRLARAIAEVAPPLAKMLEAASEFVVDWDANPEADPEDEDPDDEEPKVYGGGRKATVSQQRTRLENAVVELLGMASEAGDLKPGALSAFPLKGDPAIQIGTTVHKYGSDEIVFRHIATLDTCDDIDGAIVESYATEAKMLLGWKEMLAELDPDVLIGYNIFGFDMDYIWKRAKELGITDRLGDGLGRLKARRIRNIKEQKLSSSALGDNFLKYFPLDGIVCVDMLKVMQRDHKLDSFKLDSVAAQFLGDHKNDLKPREIFEKFGGTSADRAEVGRYCLQDCALVNRLLHKLKVLENNVGMGNVCSVPLSFLFMRGQGIKIFSLVSKECRLKQMLIPVIHKPRPYGVELEDLDLGVGYEGAIVLEPQAGMYLDTPITVLDYASLYPTSMIERNLSHDCFVMNETYKKDAEEAGTEFITVTYDIYEGMGEKKTKTGVQSCTFAQPKPCADGAKQRGTIPEILIKLINQRKNTRNKIEYETVTVRTGERYAGLPKRMENGDIKLYDVDLGATKHVDAADIVSVARTYSTFEQAVLDALQQAYKVTANSLYGQIGARTSPLYWKDIAACTTATGRERIMMAKEFVEKEYGAEVIYGDSVASYTPVYVRVNSKLDICTIEELATRYGRDQWISCTEEGKQTKQACELNGVETWTEKGWTPLKRVIRHELAQHKQMIRVLTHTGLVDVTDDHSLVGLDGACLTPKNVSIGTELLHHALPMPESIANKFTIDQARVMGFFFGDGSCGVYDCPSGMKSSWALNNASEEIIEKYLELCDNAYPELDWVAMPTLESSGVYKISPRSKTYGAIKSFITEYRGLMYYKNAKVVPLGVLHGSHEIRQAFWQGLYDADGDKDVNNYTRIDQKNQISAAQITWLAESLGWSVSINTRVDKPNIFRMTATKKRQRKNPCAIKKLGAIPYSGFVYDLTTENHHFAAGIGRIVCHNTDSIFIKFPTISVTGIPLTGKAALPLAIAAGQRAAREIKRILPAPQSLEYEKTLFPFILFSKKRYVGNLYEDDAEKKPKQKSMGIVLKRRDNAQIVKIIYGGIIDLLMKGAPLQESVEFLQYQLQQLVDGITPLDELVVTKTLRGHYKNPQQIAHKVLADRMGERDAGNKPAANDRVPYIYVVPPPGVEVRLQGDRIEHPDYIREHKLKPDYRHYITNQIMKPVSQLFALCVEQLPGYTFAPSYWIEWANELETKAMYKDNPKKISDRISVLKMRVVEELLFDKFIDQLACVTVGSKKQQTRKLRLIVGPPNAIALPITPAGPFHISIGITIEKSKGYVVKVKTVHEGVELQGEALTFEKCYPKKRPNTKTYLTCKAAEQVLDYLAREKEDAVTAHGLSWAIEDKGALRTWKKTLECVHELEDRFKKAEEEADIAANEVLQELQFFAKLAWAREHIGYVFA